MSTLNVKIIKLALVNSTNDYLKQLAHLGESAPLVVVADEQTGGKGTKNRSFISKKGGIYLSILIKPKAQGFDATLVTPMTAVAVLDTIEQFTDKSIGIKWVNDIYSDGKKCAGILCESVINENGQMPYIVVGIGVNLFAPYGGFSPEIKDIAINILEEYNAEIKERFVNALIDNFFKYYQNIENKTFLQKYRDKNLVLGKNVTVADSQGHRSALALAIDDNCRLLVEFEDKTKKYLSSGEVSLKL